MELLSPGEISKVLRGMEQLCWGENLTGLGLFSLEEPQGDPIVASQDLKEPTGKMERDP